MAEHGGNGLKARPTVYKGIQMRSRLEAGFAAWLDEKGAVWKYEPQCYASEEGQYLPDFLVRDVRIVCGDGAASIDLHVEIKPSRPSDDEMGRCARILLANDVRVGLIFVHAEDPRHPLLVTCGYDGPDWLYWVDTVPGIGLAWPVVPPWLGEWWKGPVA